MHGSEFPDIRVQSTLVCLLAHQRRAQLYCSQEDVEHASGWKNVLEASLCALEELPFSSKHGLCSDFMAYDPKSKRYHAVKTQVLERPGDGTFSWNACRCALRALCVCLVDDVAGSVRGHDRRVAGNAHLDTLEGKGFVKERHAAGM